MAFVWPGFEFRVGLGCDEPRMGIQLDHFHDAAIRRYAAEAHAVFNQFLAIVIVDLVTMTVTFINFTGAVELISFGIRVKNTFVSAKSQSTAQICNSVLVRHNVNEWMCRCRIQLGAVGIRISENMAGEFHNGHLHAKAETEERNIIFTGVLNSCDLTFYTTVTKAARDEDTVHITENFRYVIRADKFRIYPFDMDF